MSCDNILGTHYFSMGTALGHIIFPQRIVQNVIFLFYLSVSKRSSELTKRKISSNDAQIASNSSNYFYNPHWGREITMKVLNTGKKWICSCRK